MKNRKYIIILFSVLFLICITGCEIHVPDYVQNVRYVKRSANSSYGVVLWDSLDGADEYNIFQKENDTIKLVATVKTTVYGLESDEQFYASESYSYAVEAVKSGKNMYCSKFVSLENDITYEDIR